MTLRTMLSRALANPRPALRYAAARARGHYYRLKFRLLRRRVIIGRRFRVVGRLDIRGPGTVIFGDDCVVLSTRYAPTTPYTHSPHAVLRFGNRVGLNGARFGCQESIDVGDDATIAESRIFDTDFHQLHPGDKPRYATTAAGRPVVIGRGAWIALGAIVMKGVRIGENSVVGAGAVVWHDVPPNVLVAGNPARVVLQLPAPEARSDAGLREEPPAAALAHR